MAKKAVSGHYEPLIEKIQGLADFWEARLDLPGVTVRHRFLEAYNDEDHSIVATTESEWVYRTATIRWYLPAMIRLSDVDLEKVIVHEYAHVLLGPISDKISKANDLFEYVTETVARAVYNVAHGK